MIEAEDTGEREEREDTEETEETVDREVAAVASEQAWT